jgi:hypothetical protein
VAGENGGENITINSDPVAVIPRIQQLLKMHKKKPASAGFFMFFFQI